MRRVGIRKSVAVIKRLMLHGRERGCTYLSIPSAPVHERIRRHCASGAWSSELQLHSPEQLELCSHRTLAAILTTPQRHHLRCRIDPYYPAMWDDEDNNPYGSFARHDSNTSDVTGLASPTACEASRINAEA